MKKLNQIMLVIVSVAVVSVFAKSTVKDITLDGVFIGANSFYYGEKDPVDMSAARLAIEPDFILVLSDGKSYFVEDISVGLKRKYYNKEVRVIGKLNEEGTVVPKKMQVFKKEKDKWITVWNIKDWEEDA